MRPSGANQPPTCLANLGSPLCLSASVPSSVRVRPNSQGWWEDKVLHTKPGLGKTLSACWWQFCSEVVGRQPGQENCQEEAANGGRLEPGNSPGRGAGAGELMVGWILQALGYQVAVWI